VDAEVQLNRNRVRRTGAMMAMASFALVVLAACGAGGAEEAREDVTRVPTMSDAAAQATREAANAPAATPGAEGGTPTTGATTAATTVDVVAQDIFFEPKELTIPANTDVTVNLTNEGAAVHNFSIDALGIDVDLPPGAKEDVVINAPAGEYEYYCNVPGHKEAGMVGKLVVTEGAAAAAPGGTAAPGATPAQGSATPATPGVATPAGSTAEATPAAGGEEQAAGASNAVEVAAYDIYFEPKELSIPADTDVTVRLPNKGVTAHNFSIDELGISVDIAPGATEETVINAPAGTYEYYCDVPGHKQAGMVGTLTVG
jgi:uncharacterized cupredoxin-like copper-binding protein